MRLIRHWQQALNIGHDSVCSIGNFDGVHLGHIDIIRQLVDTAKQQQRLSGLMIFEPQPLEFFRESDAPARLMTFREKFECLSTLGLDWLACFRFNQAFANLSAEHFVENILIKHLSVRRLVIGSDFRFGANRRGDTQLLKQLSDALGFELVIQEDICQNQARISSSAVRREVKAGDFDKAQSLLGRSFQIAGRVSHGNKMARTIGVPTANILLHRQVLPLRGVYCVSAHWRGKTYPAIANVGVRPTVGGTRALLEVHLLTTQAELYGERLTVTFCQKLRDERRFDTFEALSQQIHQDVLAARAFWRCD